jgi:hypothetical protein
MPDTNRSSTRRRVEVVAVEDGLVSELADFYRAVWDPRATAESVRAARAAAAVGNLAEPGKAPPTFAVVMDAKIVAYVSSLPVRVRAGGEDQPAYWAKGLMVLPEYRNGPLGYTVLKALVGSLSRSLVLTVAPASRRLFGSLGYADHGAVPNFLKLLRPNRVLARLDLERLQLQGLPRWAPAIVRGVQRTGLAMLGGHVLGAVAACRAAMSARSGGGMEISLSADPPDAALLEELWRDVRPGFPLGVARNAPYMLSRYARPHAGEVYRWAVVGQGTKGPPVAAAVVRRPGGEDPRLAGIRVATLADLAVSVENPVAALAALSGAERIAREWDADGVLATVSHPAAIRALQRRAWVRIPGNVHFLTRNASGSGAPWSSSLEDWWLCRGDGESDQAL